MAILRQARFTTSKRSSLAASSLPPSRDTYTLNIYLRGIQGDEKHHPAWMIQVNSLPVWVNIEIIVEEISQKRLRMGG